MATLDKFRGLENSVITQANNDPEKQKEQINKYSHKIKELKSLLDEFHPDRAESHIFLYEVTWIDSDLSSVETNLI